jgi:hypothetical protein
LVLVTAIGLLIALATIAWAAFAAITVSARQEASESASYSGVQSVTVDTDDADVAITTGSGDATRVEQKVQWSFRRPAVSVGQQRESADYSVALSISDGVELLRPSEPSSCHLRRQLTYTPDPATSLLPASLPARL